MSKKISLIIISFIFIFCNDKKLVVFQSDFGEKDGAVAAMKGVALSVDKDLGVYDITHEIPAYNIWEAAYRLDQAVKLWPKGTVFVSVVDPGVGTERRSVVLKTKTGHFIVSPDNGTLTLVAQNLGIKEIREIDEEKNRRENTEESYTFHGRDLYAYTGARLAASRISFEKLGKRLPDSVVTIAYQQAEIINGTIRGNIPVLDVQYGNVWTNISDSLIHAAGWKYGDSLMVMVSNNDSMILQKKIVFKKTFGEVNEGNALAYINSLMNFSLAVNMGDFAKRYNIYSGPTWTVVLSRP